MPGRKSRSIRMSGLFDWLDSLKSKRKAPTSSLIALPAPGSGLPAQLPEKKSLIERAPTRALKERLTSALNFFSVPSQGLIRPEGKALSKEPTKKLSWDLRFEPEEEEIPHELLAPAQEDVLIMPGRTQESRGWAFPDMHGMATQLANQLDLHGIFDGLLRMRENPEYEEALADQTSRGAPLYTPVSVIDDNNFYVDFGAFYGIPDEIVESMRTPEEFQRDYLSPLGLLLTQTFEEIQPEGLPGFFVVDYNSQDGKYWLFYGEPWVGSL